MPPQKLFWFLKKDRKLDLFDPSSLEMYIQQVISHGTMGDIKSLLVQVNANQFKQAFSGIKGFLSWEVRSFWEDFFASY